MLDLSHRVRITYANIGKINKIRALARKLGAVVHVTHDLGEHLPLDDSGRGQKRSDLQNLDTDQQASAGLAFDYVHLTYLATGDLRVSRTQRDAAGGVQLRVERPRPILPPGVKPPPTTN